MNIVQIGEKHMQAIMETLFDAAYLVTVVTLGCICLLYTSYLPSPSEIAETGHTPAQVPQAMQSSEIL